MLACSPIGNFYGCILISVIRDPSDAERLWQLIGAACTSSCWYARQVLAIRTDSLYSPCTGRIMDKCIATPIQPHLIVHSTQSQPDKPDRSVQLAQNAQSPLACIVLLKLKACRLRWQTVVNNLYHLHGTATKSWRRLLVDVISMSRDCRDSLQFNELTDVRCRVSIAGITTEGNIKGCYVLPLNATATPIEDIDVKVFRQVRTSGNSVCVTIGDTASLIGSWISWICQQRYFHVAMRH